MSNLEFSTKPVSYSPARLHVGLGGRTTKQKLQLAVNVALISAAFLFVAAAVLGIFP